MTRWEKWRDWLKRRAPLLREFFWAGYVEGHDIGRRTERATCVVIITTQLQYCGTRHRRRRVRRMLQQLEEQRP